MIALALALALAQDAAPGKPVVYAWFPRDMNDWDTSRIDWTAITHLCLRSVVLQPDGTLKPGWNVQRMADVVKEARRRGVKVTVLAWGTNAQNSSTYLAHHPEKTVEALLAFVKAHDLDGVNIDDETWKETNAVTGAPNRDLVTRFFKILQEKFKAARADYHLTYASPGVISPEDRLGDAWIDYKAIADLIDGFTVMSYVMNPPSIGWTGASQPLEGGGKVGKHARDYATLMADYLAVTGGRKDKILFGIANDYGGTEWTCRGDGPRAPIVGKPRRLSAAEARANAEKHGRLYDETQKAPWYRYRDGERWVQGWYEDEASLRAKLEWIRAQGVAGICVWVLGAQEPPETYRLIREVLSN